MRKLIVISCLLLSSGLASAAMVLNDSIHNDPIKEKLCISRALKTTRGKIVPFEIDSDYVATARSLHPDTTFIAIDGDSPSLIECFLREGTGRYEPDSFSPEQRYWHTIKPTRFEPGINTDKGISMAAHVCIEAAQSKSTRSGFDHSVYTSVIEVNLSKAGTSIAGKKAKRYDIAVKGTSYYKSSKQDLTAVNFTCLLSPMLDVKAIQLK